MRLPLSVGLPAGPAVWLLGAAETVSWGLLYYSFGVLLRPMAAALGASEAEISGSFSVALLAAGIAAPFVGRAVDRAGAGPVMTAGSLLGTLGFALASGVQSTAQLYAVWALMGIAYACTSYEPAFAAVTAWLQDAEARRRALLVITSFGGLASTIFVPFAAFVVEGAGLRPAMMIFALVLGLVLVPLHVAIATVRRPAHPPAPSVVSPVPASPGLLGGVLALHAFASTGVAAFLIPAFLDRGITLPDAAALVALLGASQVLARLLYPFLCRRVPARARLSMLLAVQGIALVGWGFLSGPALVAALVAFGAANGLMTLERASVIADWFGVTGYGARSGNFAAGSMLARAAAPVAMAVVARHASYASAFLIVACSLGIAVLMQVFGEWRRIGSATGPAFTR
ncbi:MAG: MFS transporter [Pseudomonadota bacterium]|nr:MFS transporter [Pseudomonadota bacterium]